MRVTRSATIAGVLALLSAQASAVTVANGSFELLAGYGTTVPGGLNLAGWFHPDPDLTMTAITASALNAQPGRSGSTASPNGGMFLVADCIRACGYNAVTRPKYNTIEQTLTGLSVGQRYDVSFYQAAESVQAFDANTGIYWDVSLGSTTLRSESIFIKSVGPATPWTKQTLTFVADSASMVLAFAANSTAAVAPEPLLFLDGVEVTAAVPEPATYVLMLGGLLGLAGLSRRREQGRRDR